MTSINGGLIKIHRFFRTNEIATVTSNFLFSSVCVELDVSKCQHWWDVEFKFIGTPGKVGFGQLTFGEAMTP